MNKKLEHYVRRYGWWQMGIIAVVLIITAAVLVDVSRGSDDAGSREHARSAAGSGGHDERGGHDGHGGHEESDGELGAGPDPGTASRAELGLRELPAGGTYSANGSGEFRPVGTPGQEVGHGAEKTIRYTVEVEEGLDTVPYGGDDAIARMVDATLADPRGWTYDPAFKFVHVGPEEDPDTRILFASVTTTADMCGVDLELETSCHTTITGGSTVLLNESRWVRGAAPFQGDLGAYRQYLINHEVGHAIGYPHHQACTGEGNLAPVMMQQTISLQNSELFQLNPEEVYPDNPDTCRPNPWPYPRPLPDGAALDALHEPEKET
ncbi:DUF3152 domain-containing protein [Corynebacterium propinquum]|uniref:DUF3152 domain-containing protein n=1 Tax=Corynebacterium propinquum TaxID=43769 RepID=UPI00254A9732|nr:DUF3152 domain-containing protein [Corynebacterium propinquum]MDK8536273.1 DUF3152 domain-containing protein [Corynebacterium propinquum]